jgi:hypothetical protein
MSLVILCASHLKQDINVIHMIEMLNSQMKQTTVCDVYVSYTGLSLNYDNPRVHLFKQPEPHLTQFQHYKRLTKLLCDTGVIHSENYAIFTDDDDIMAPERNAEYLRLIHTGIEVVLINKSILRFSLEYDLTKPASLEKEFNKKGQVVPYLTPNEYVELCLRGDILVKFMDWMDEKKSKNYVGDCLFYFNVIDYIDKNPDTTLKIDAEKPLYHYRYSMLIGDRFRVNSNS